MNDQERLRRLTGRQLQILALAAEGLTNKAIGRRLGISDQTVKNTLTIAYRNLGAVDRCQAVTIAVREHLMSPERREWT